MFVTIAPGIDNVFIHPRESSGLEAILLTKLDEVLQGLISPSRAILLALHCCQGFWHTEAEHFVAVVVGCVLRRA